MSKTEEVSAVDKNLQLKHKHKITATIKWTLETDSANPKKLAADLLKSILPQNFAIQISKLTAKAEKPLSVKEKQQSKNGAPFFRGEFSLEEVFSKLSDKNTLVKFTVGPEEFLVRMNSRRYALFQQNPCCVVCGLKGNKFHLEQNADSKICHFNLYGEENGELVAMTRDHIHARSKGGRNSYSNLQVMCAICNNLKGSSHISLVGVAALRKIYNEHKLTLSKGSLARRLAQTRKLFKTPRWNSKSGLIAKFDLQIIETESGFKITPQVWDHNGVACIRQGMPIRCDLTFDIGEEILAIPPDFVETV